MGEAREKKAREKMERVASLTDEWKQSQAVDASKPSKSKKNKGDAPPGGVDDETGIFDNDVATTNQSALFDDSDDDDSEDDTAKKSTSPAKEVGDSSQKSSQQDLFGDSSEEDTDDEGKSTTKKRPQDIDNQENERAAKKSK